MKIFKNKEGKQLFLSAILLVIVIALYVELNVLIGKINMPIIDITEDKTYSLSQESKNIISKIDKNIKITLVNFEKYNSPYINDILPLIREYSKYNNKISVEATESKADDKNNQFAYIVIECDGKSKIISIDEMHIAKYNELFGYQDEYYVAEPIITNSIENMSCNINNNMYIFLDKSVYSVKMYLSLVNMAGALGIETYGLSLADSQEIPEDCKCVIIPPLVEVGSDGNIISCDLSNSEKDIIKNYINKGGNILFIQESKTLLNVETPNLDYIMGLYGVNISDGIIGENQNRIQDIPTYIYPELNEKSIANKINKKSKICVFDAGKININNEINDVKHEIILSASDNAFLRKELNNSISKIENDEDSPNAIIGMYAEKCMGDITSKAIIFSNSVLFTNNPVFLNDRLSNKRMAVEAVLVDDNADMIINSVATLTNSQNAIYSAKRKYNIVPSINILNDRITLKIIFFIPVLILFIGFIVWKHRKNKK